MSQKLKFSDKVTNISASGDNPTKQGIFICHLHGGMAEYATALGVHRTPLSNLTRTPQPEQAKPDGNNHAPIVAMADNGGSQAPSITTIEPVSVEAGARAIKDALLSGAIVDHPDGKTSAIDTLALAKACYLAAGIPVKE